MERRNLENSTAYIDIYRTEKAAKAVVVICPGGGYRFLSEREAEPIAKKFVDDGYMAVVLWYEVKAAKLGDLPLWQLSDTMIWVREHEEEYQVQNKNIYVCGFSAGGHLAANLGILWNQKEYFRAGTDLLKHKPAGMILSYPVISSGEYAHRGSFVRLAGEKPQDQERYSLEKKVDQDCVPTFLWGTFADDQVPVENSLLLLNELAKNKIPTEYHLFPNGVHGLSLANEEVSQPEKHREPDKHIARWMSLCLEWLDHVMEKLDDKQ